jgi:hypothetical protein
MSEEPAIPLSVAGFQPGQAKFVLGFEMRVEGALSRASRINDLLDSGAMIALLIEQLGSDVYDLTTLGPTGLFLCHDRNRTQTDWSVYNKIHFFSFRFNAPYRRPSGE